MSDFRIGEIVDVTIKGSRVVGIGYDDRFDSPWLRVAIPIGDDEMHGRIHLDAPGITVERVAPAKWPPQPGDLWRDNGGTLWFAVEDDHGTVTLTCSGRNRRPAADILALYAPLTRVHRESEPDEEVIDDPKSWTDSAGRVWDLTIRYSDRVGGIWHWAGGFASSDDGPLEPMFSRDDWSIQDIRISDVTARYGPLMPMDRKGGERS
jgi:hypothetical protein